MFSSELCSKKIYELLLGNLSVKWNFNAISSGTVILRVNIGENTK